MKNPFRNRTPHSRTALVTYHIHQEQSDIHGPEGGDWFGRLARPVLRKSGMKRLYVTIQLAQRRL